jgi:FlaA1/EpsC-like NDP-sugar epimerase
VFIIMETLCPYLLSVVCTYIFALAFSLWLAYHLRFDFAVPEKELVTMRRLGIFIVPLQLALLMWRRQFVGLLSYFDVPEMKQLLSGLGWAAAIQMIVWFISDGSLMPARSIILMNFIIACVVIGGTRMILRMLRETRSNKERQLAAGGTLRVGIVGAGEMGSWLAHELNFRHKGGRSVEVFFDDDPDKWQKQLQGVPVVGMPECILDGSWAQKLDEVIVAMPTATPERLKQIKSILGSANIRARTMPSLEQILLQ